MISSSLDWSKLETKLMNKASKLVHGREVMQMIINIRPEITQLSIAEVESRHGRTHKAEELLNKVNADITMLEEYLLIAALIG